MMASSVILRNESGEIKGYAIVQKENLLVMAKGNGESGRLILESEGGERVEYAVVCSGREITLPFSAAALSSGWLLTDTEDKGATQEQSTAAKTGENPYQSTEADSVYKEGGKNERVSKERGGMNRWPPPPCWPTARYVDGVWCEEDERTPECI